MSAYSFSSFHEPRDAMDGPTPKWRCSPNHLRRSNCSCVRSRHAFTTADEFVAYQVDRFDKVWTRLTHSSTTGEVLNAVERVVRQLGAEGLELTHFAGHEVDPSIAGPKTRKFRVVLLVPDPDDEKIGHRWVAEVMVDLKKSNGESSIVAVRYATDWEEWTIAQTFDYFRPEGDEKKGEPVRVAVPDRNDGVSWDMVMDQLEKEVKKLSEGAYMSSQEFRYCITRTTRQLGAEGMKVAGFEVEKVYRTASVRSKQARPNLRIAIKVLAEGEEERKKGEHADEPGAVALMDYTTTAEVSGKKGKVKAISIIYRGEWPICQHYRRGASPPDISTLLSVAQDR